MTSLTAAPHIPAGLPVLGAGLRYCSTSPWHSRQIPASAVQGCWNIAMGFSNYGRDKKSSSNYVNIQLTEPPIVSVIPNAYQSCLDPRGLLAVEHLNILDSLRLRLPLLQYEGLGSPLAPSTLIPHNITPFLDRRRDVFSVDVDVNPVP